ncbi:hypothetical protein [Streptomyces sp. NPDC088746]|uniref:hypothetical protein n=1 Tax=Streptomyces sp. NPDC088746 TaxID=3365885 RepID=UPI0038111E77
MSRYETDKVLWNVYCDPGAAAAFTADPAGFLAGRDLLEGERDALVTRDVRALIVAGAHPFLVYNFALRLAGGFSMPFVMDYVAKLRGLTTGDYTT